MDLSGIKDDPSTMRMLYNEINGMKALNHPNIVRLQEVNLLLMYRRIHIRNESNVLVLVLVLVWGTVPGNETRTSRPPRCPGVAIGAGGGGGVLPQSSAYQPHKSCTVHVPYVWFPRPGKRPLGG